MEERPGVSMGGTTGLDLVKLRISRTNGAWNTLFKITQWNYVAFSAAIALSTTGIVAKFFEQNMTPVLALVCIFVIIASTTSAVLSYLFLNYAYDLHWHEKKAERAWLKDKDGRQFVREMQATPSSPFAKRAEAIELTRNGLLDLVTNIYFLINAAPAAVSLILLILLIVLATLR